MKSAAATRVARHRAKQREMGTRRVDVVVPQRFAVPVMQLAIMLRSLPADTDCDLVPVVRVFPGGRLLWLKG